MPMIEYKEKRFNDEHLNVIDRANAIIAEYQAQGYTLTLRQLYYQFVSRDYIANKVAEYKRLGSIIGDARLAGLIDWEALEDRGRNLVKLPTWSDPQSIIRACASQFRLDAWEDQLFHVEVWVEKEALIGVIEPACNRLRIGAFACKGYVSLSEMWDAGHNRFRNLVRNAGKQIVILHMGDHDPSGIDMTRDMSERLELLSGGKIIIKRIALNMDQVDEFNPPPNPAKATDARFKSYQDKFGDESWELDALPPNILVGLIDEWVKKYRDQPRFDAMIRRENEHREDLKLVAEEWEDVKEFARHRSDR